jgi:hypothetical protein
MPPAWGDVDFYTARLHVRESKSGEAQRVSMSESSGRLGCSARI